MERLLLTNMQAYTVTVLAEPNYNVVLCTLFSVDRRNRWVGCSE